MPAMRVVIVAIAAILLGSLFILGCSASGDSPAEKNNVRESASKGESILVGNTKTEKLIGNLKITASIPSAQIKPGEILRLSLSVRNIGSELQKLSFNSSQKFDVRIEDSSGGRVWQWSDGRMFAQLLESITLEPGKSVSFTVQWPLTDTGGKAVAPGNYNIYAKIMANRLRSEEVKLKVSIQ
ncbi:MAG: hypothetical protein K6T91_01415 [Firmicutes bacterium]|nr:hypothetical protein [Bacillota bacterium]